MISSNSSRMLRGGEEVEKFIPIKVVLAHGKLVEWMRYLREWRKQHEQLAVMTGPTRGLGLALGEKWEWEGGCIWRRLRRLMRSLSGLMFSMLVLLSPFLFSSFHTLIWVPYTEGAEIWVTAENAYNERVSRVENQILARLRDRLGTARNAKEMFRVFSKFNALFVRPKVRAFLAYCDLSAEQHSCRFVVRYRSTRRNSSIR